MSEGAGNGAFSLFACRLIGGGTAAVAATRTSPPRSATGKRKPKPVTIVRTVTQPGTTIERTVTAPAPAPVTTAAGRCSITLRPSRADARRSTRSAATHRKPVASCAGTGPEGLRPPRLTALLAYSDGVPQLSM